MNHTLLFHHFQSSDIHDDQRQFTLSEETAGEVGAAAQTGIHSGNTAEFANHSAGSQELSFYIKTATEKANKAQWLQRGSIRV